MMMPRHTASVWTNVPFCLVVVVATIAAWTTITTTSTTLVVSAFVPPTASSRFRNQRSHSHSQQHVVLYVGDFLSGLTNSAPSQLEVPSELLSGTTIDPNRPNVDLQCVYKASVDGWSAVNFHSCVDGRGSAIVVALNRSGKRFGGYNPLGWMSTDDYGSSNAAFLWCSNRNSDDTRRFPILSGGNTAIYDYATGGPCFGAADLVIGPPQAAIMGGFAGPDMMDTSINAGNLKECNSSPGGAYDFDTTSGWPLGKCQLVELEVYCNANIDASNSSGSGGLPSWWPFS